MMGRFLKTGRPRGPAGDERLAASVAVKLTAAQRQRLEELCAAQAKPVAQMVRQMIQTCLDGVRS